MREGYRATRVREVAVTAIAAFALVIAAPSARAAEDEGLAYEGAVGLASAVSSLIYGPVKVAYAVGGLAVSTLTFLWTFADTSVSGAVFEQTVGGDYVVTPSHLQGRRELRFFGP